MSRRWWMGLAAVAVVAGGLVFAGFRSGPGPGGVPTLEVTRERLLVRVTAEGNLEAVTSTPLTAPVTRGRHKIAWIVDDGSRVDEGDVVVRFDPTDFDQARERGIADQQKVDHRLDRARRQRTTTVRNLDRDADLARSEAEQARQFQSLDTSIYSRNEILESSIDTELAEDRAAFADASKEVESALAKADIELLEIKRRMAELKLEEAREGLAKLEITAPHPGLVILERDWRGNPPRVGETAWPGRSLATIPDLTEMQAEVFVLEADAGGLAVGQAATVVVEARPDRAIRARVESVDPVAQRRVGWVPVQYFRTVLALELEETAWLKPGQRVTAEILIADRAEVIAIPRQAVSTEDGQHVVHRWTGDGFTPVAVELGPSGLGRVVIETGLESGDVVALTDPDRRTDDEDGTAENGGPGA